MHSNFTEVYTITDLENLYFQYFSVIQFGSDSNLDDVLYTSPITNETIYYPLENSNAITLDTILSETGLTLDYC